MTIAQLSVTDGNYYYTVSSDLDTETNSITLFVLACLYVEEDSKPHRMLVSNLVVTVDSELEVTSTTGQDGVINKLGRLDYVEQDDLTSYYLDSSEGKAVDFMSEVRLDWETRPIPGEGEVCEYAAIYCALYLLQKRLTTTTETNGV